MLGGKSEGFVLKKTGKMMVLRGDRVVISEISSSQFFGGCFED